MWTMGYDIHKFVEVVDANLLCGICGLVFEDPVLTPCGHSFCLLCLETWLETSRYQIQNRQLFHRTSTLAGSCPECRETVLPNQAKPELSLRNLINGFYKYCEFRDQGCHATIKLEQSKSHASRCPHSPVVCAGCGESVQSINLPNHQIHCRGIAATISEDEDCKPENLLFDSSICKETAEIHQLAWKKTQNSIDFSELLKQMENQISILKKDLLLADVNNAIIESEYLLRKSEMKKKYGQVLLAQGSNNKTTTIEPQLTAFQKQSSASRDDCHPPTSKDRSGLNWLEYPGDHERLLPYSIPTVSASRMASFIFRFLLNKPDYIDSRMVFEAIQRCYDHFVSSSSLYDYSVHVLIATAGASDWFTTMQRQYFSQWLQSLAKCRELMDSSSLTRQKKQPVIWLDGFFYCFKVLLYIYI